jgi:hypothetical protein
MLISQLDEIVTEFISQCLTKTIFVNIMNVSQDSTFYAITCTLNNIDL